MGQPVVAGALIGLCRAPAHKFNHEREHGHGQHKRCEHQMQLSDDPDGSTTADPSNVAILSIGD